jgi:hypothetical protein
VLSREGDGESVVKLRTFHFLRYKLSIIIPHITVQFDPREEVGSSVRE